MTTYSTTQTARTNSHAALTPDHDAGLAHHAQTLKDDLATVKDDAAAAATALGARLQQDAECVVDAAKAGGERARQFHEGVCEQVSKRPTAAMLIAVSAGVVLGKFLAR